MTKSPLASMASLMYVLVGYGSPGLVSTATWEKLLERFFMCQVVELVVL